MSCETLPIPDRFFFLFRPIFFSYFVRYLIFAGYLGVVCVLTLLLLSVSTGSTLGEKYDLILALRSQIFEDLRDYFSGVP